MDAASASPETKSIRADREKAPAGEGLLLSRLKRSLFLFMRKEG
jgi:hypothetical protein